MEKIIDCFLFNDEIEMLKFRFHELNEYVDAFLILESDCLFDGTKKKYFLEEMLDTFGDFSNKIIYLKVSPPSNISPIEILKFYTDSLKIKFLNLGLKYDDIILYSDIDEIPNFLNFNQIKEELVFNPVILKQKNFFWNKKYISKILHYGTTVMLFSHFLIDKEIFIKSKGHDKFSLNYGKIENGWHFSNFFTLPICFEKIKTLSEISYKNSFYSDIFNIEFLINNLLPLSPLPHTKFLRLKEYNGDLPINHNLLPNHDVGRKEKKEFTIILNNYKTKIDIPKTELYSNENTKKFGFEKVYFLNEMKNELYDFYPIDDDIFIFPEMNKEISWSVIKNSFLSDILLN